MKLEQQNEAILFWKRKPVSKKKHTETISVDQTQINEALIKLKEIYQSRGIVLIEKDSEVMLGTAPEFTDLIENLQKEELNKELSKASLETLSIVLYKNGASRSEIDYIRGVNSSFTLRSLSVRGLVERITDPKDNRRHIYRPSFELLSYMGIKSIEELPEYDEVHKETKIAAKNLEEELKNEE